MLSPTLVGLAATANLLATNVVAFMVPPPASSGTLPTPSLPSTKMSMGSQQSASSVLAGLMIGSAVLGGGSIDAWAAEAAAAPTAVVQEVEAKENFDGFADFAEKGNKMEQSDVSCFANQCGVQTKSCFTDGSCIKGVTCLGRCKGEQECATRCFAEYGGPKLDDWLTCTLEDHSCVKIPKVPTSVPQSASTCGNTKAKYKASPEELKLCRYKVLGVNSKYDSFDCQRNSFDVEGRGDVAEIGVEFRLRKPGTNGDFWANSLNEKLLIDPPGSQRSFHTEGKMFGLTFKENWYVTGLSEEPGKEFVFVQYKGHTLQGSYEGGFVYAKQPRLPDAAKPAVARVAKEHNLEFDKLIAIDNTCPIKPALPKSGDSNGMGLLARVKYEAGFLFDLLEWVNPGTIHEYD
ncbi:unnamed protein product [Chrysoparadoxa australica]